MDGLATQCGMMGQPSSGFAQAASIVALWDFETGATTTDSAGSNDLTRVGVTGPTTVTGKIGDGAGGFSTSDYFETAAHVGPSGTAAKTYFGWFKTGAGLDSTILSVGESTAAEGDIVIIRIESGVFFIRCSSRVASAGSGLDDGTWHSFVIVFPETPNMSDVSYYLDGALAASTVSDNGSLDMLESEFKIGVTGFGSPSNAFTGDIDQIGIADTAWTSADAADFHNSGAGRPTSYLLT